MEAEVARQMGISRGPVREALRDLVQKGLLVSTPRKGTSVISFTMADAREIYILRLTLEPLAARLALPRIREADIHELKDMVERMTRAAEAGDVVTQLDCDFAFHAAIHQMAGHQRLSNILEGISAQVRLFLFASTTRGSRDLLQISVSHLDIVDALERGKAERVEEVIRSHVESAWSHLVPYLPPEPEGAGRRH